MDGVAAGTGKEAQPIQGAGPAVEPAGAGFRARGVARDGSRRSGRTRPVSRIVGAALALMIVPFLPGTAVPAGATAAVPAAKAGPGEPMMPAAAPVAAAHAAGYPVAAPGSASGWDKTAAPGAGVAAAVDLEQLTQRQWEETEGAGSFLEALDRVRQQVGEALPGLDWERTLKALRQGQLPWDAGDLFGALLRALAGEVITNGGLLLRLLVLAVLLAVLQAIENAFDNEAVARAAYAVTYLALIALALVSFRDALAISQQAIQGLVDFLLASLPVLLTLMASTGALATAGILHPLVVATAHSTSVIIGQWVLPLIFLAAVVDIAGHFPVGTSLSGLSRLLRQAALLILGLAGTVFLAVVAIQGAAGTVADGIALRTAKYLVGAFVPVVGGMLADSVELVVTSSLLLKNAVNLLGMLAVFALVAFPLLKLVALVFVYRLVAAAIQPVGPGHVTGALQSMGDHLVLVGAATAVVGLMFFIVLAVMLAAGNAAVMMR